MVGSIKDIAIVITLVLSIGGAVFASGKHTQAIAETRTDVSENKEALKETQKINVEQTVAITEAVTTLKGLTKAFDKMVDKLDK